MDRDDYLDRGQDYFDKKDFDRAIADYTEAIRLDPDYPTAYTMRGAAYASRYAVYHNKGDSDRAIADCEKAVRLDPDDEWYCEKLEEMKVALGN